MTEPLRLTAVIALALAIAGCPAPTGRRRGALDQDGGACSVTSLPFTGEACPSEGAGCDFSVPCAATSRAIHRCTCAGGRWRCTTLACEQLLPDGTLPCPAARTPQSMSFACDPRLAGRTCPLAPIVCADRSRPTLECTCDGTYWRCSFANCEELPTWSGVTIAGRVCTSASECSPLTCDESLVRGGVCSRPCDPTATRALIAERCAFAQCARFGGTVDQPAGICVRPCTPNTGACPAGTVCSDLVPASGATPPFGCVPFCRADNQCPTGQRCRTASGQCTTRDDAPVLLEDGQPCTDDPSQPFRCRGRCVPSSHERGAPMVCASISYGGLCPPVNGRPAIETRVGELTFCLGQSCNDIDCCPSGEACERRFDRVGSTCGTDTAIPNILCRDSGVDRPDALADAHDDAFDHDTIDSDSGSAIDAGD
ncbi:MAG: hypothetical protein JNK05_03790 [Myxococcales bacterium]|nr:hypothetical protein [Myxococcales bacterium]